MSQLKMVWFCPNCGQASYSKSDLVPPACCDNSAPELVTPETSRLAGAAFFALQRYNFVEWKKIS